MLRTGWLGRAGLAGPSPGPALTTVGAMPPTPAETRLSPGELEAMLAVTRRLAAPTDLHALLGEVTQAACRVLHAERASVWLLDADRGELVLEVAADLSAVRLPVDTGLLGVCARERAVVNVPDCDADPRFNPAMDRQTGFRTRCSLTLPLIDPSEALVGVLQVLNRKGGAFQSGDEALGTALAAQCAVALQRARMTAALLEGEVLRQELELARTVQMSTLPAKVPPLPGYGMHASFRPASITGGDTYDLARLRDGSLLVVLGDAAGHGIAPALSVTQMHAMLRMAIRFGADLAVAFREVNDQLSETLPDSRFVTAFIGVLDPPSGHLRYVNAGQAPILLLRAATRQFIRLKPTSFPMGAMPMAEPRPLANVTLEPGDLLVLASDGLYEQENGEAQAFGTARAEAHLLATAGESVDVRALGLLARFDAFHPPRPQEDDLTLVLLQRDPVTVLSQA